MQIEDRTLDSIRPYPGNPRRNDKAVDRVAASIKNFGFRQPIVVDDKGIIVVGHTRYKAARKLGMETVPSLNLVFTEEEGYVTAEHAEARGLHVRKLSGTQFRQMLRSGEEIPEWFAFRSVVDVLRAAA